MVVLNRFPTENITKTLFDRVLQVFFANIGKNWNVPNRHNQKVTKSIYLFKLFYEYQNFSFSWHNLRNKCSNPLPLSDKSFSTNVFDIFMGFSPFKDMSCIYVLTPLTILVQYLKSNTSHLKWLLMRSKL